MPPRKSVSTRSGNSRVPVPPVKFENGKATSSAIQKSSPVKKRRGFIGFLRFLALHVTILYTLFAALFTCSPSPFSFKYSTNDPRAVCRTLAHGKAHLVPLVTPAIQSVHKKVDPYTGPYIKAVSPYTNTAWKTAKPYYRQATKQSQLVYKKRIDPLRKKAIKRGRAYTDPHLKTVHQHYKKQVKPHVDNFNKAVRPYQDIYRRDVAPYLSQAYAQSLTAGGASYAFYVSKVHPQVVYSMQQLHSFYINHFDPAVRRSYSLYIRPQSENLLAKIFERKAHATGSEAISEVKEEVKAAAKEAKTRTAARQTEAVEAIKKRRRNDPEAKERAEQAAHAFVESIPDNIDEIEEARLEAEFTAETEKVNEQLEAWEVGMTKLLGQEYKLFTERVSELRNRRLADLPDQFAALTETHIEDEIAATLARLERSYKKLAKSDLSVSDQIAQANQLHASQKAKLVASQQNLEKQVDSYLEDLVKDEVKSMTASVGELRRYVIEARKSFVRIMSEVKFEKTEDDHQGWDGGMMRRAIEYENDLKELLKDGKVLQGLDAVDLTKEPRLGSHIADLQSRVKRLYSIAGSQVDSYVNRGNMQLRGEGVLGSISDATDAVSDQARALSEGTAASMYDVAMAARKKLGIASKDATGILDRVKNGAYQASQSISSAVGSTPSAKSAGEYVRDYVDSASSKAASAAGYKNEPESYLDNIGDAAQKVFDSAASSAASAGKGASDDYNAAVKAGGESFTAATTSAGNIVSSASESIVKGMPTGVPGGDAAQSIYNVAQEQYGSISHSAAKAAESIAGGSPYDSIKDGVNGASEVIAETAKAAKDAVIDAVQGQDSNVVGKAPPDKDYNTVGKAAGSLKDKIVHADL